MTKIKRNMNSLTLVTASINWYLQKYVNLNGGYLEKWFYTCGTIYTSSVKIYALLNV